MAWASTGFKGLDTILCNLNKGDNIVWQVDSIDDYEKFVSPYIKKAIEDKRNVIYVRFARHAPLATAQPGLKIYELNANTGFEAFSTQVHNIISENGLEAYYVFDCLSDLLNDWATDLMIGNFFMVTCPYLYELDTIAYFAVLRNHHSHTTIARIRGTTQLLLDLHNIEGNYYVHPLKVWNRHSATMFLPHLKQAEEFTPLVSSIDSAMLFSHVYDKTGDNSVRILDYWDRLFIDAEKLLNLPPDSAEIRQTITRLCRLIIGREKRISELAEKNFRLNDLINIKKRLIGSGMIGGKAAGMLIAKKILENSDDFDSEKKLERHDSFYVGSDVFYTYIVENGWWKLLMEHKTPEGYFSVAEELREKILSGKFPSHIRERFQEMIEYFGQSPIIVRSSSLLEDSFGNAFAGKYESIFLVNQGDPELRYSQFENAVRHVFASTMSEDALSYRIQRGLDKEDEQMALLVQRVSGSHRNHYFFPDLAGVGVSHNTFVWQENLDPHAGMLRLVFGLGTRAVDRVEDDYPRTIALDAPLLRPHAGMDDIIRFSQHKVDLLNTAENSHDTVNANDILNENIIIDRDLIAIRDYEAEQKMQQLGLKKGKSWVLTFEKLLSETDFTSTMQKILKTLEKEYNYPVDVEFTVNFTPDQKMKVNLVQCRPLQTRGLKANVKIPEKISPDKIIFQSRGHSMGGNISHHIARIIYIDPSSYIDLPLNQKYEVARIIGKLNRLIGNKELTPTLLMGPGRWGTTTPSLGVPVSFSEINFVSVLIEIAYEGGNLMPELSFGTHFFQDLVESEIFYAALFPELEETVLNKQWFLQAPNQLSNCLPEHSKYEHVIKLLDIPNHKLHLMGNLVTQKVVCFLE